MSNPFDQPAIGYQVAMRLIHARLVVVGNPAGGSLPLFRAEMAGVAVRKVVEGLAFAALSAAEHHNPKLPRSFRTKDASHLLSSLDSKGLLRLPEANDVLPPSDDTHVAILQGRPERNLTAAKLKAMYSRASAIIHERHPERLTDQAIAQELATLEQDVRDLRLWLWTHVTFIQEEAYAIQMDRIHAQDFWISLSKV